MSTEQLDKRRRKLGANGVIELTRGIPFEPLTAPGRTRFEMTNGGPMRPGKTWQDYTRPDERPRVKDWQRRSEAMRRKGNQEEEVAA